MRLTILVGDDQEIDVAKLLITTKAVTKNRYKASMRK